MRIDICASSINSFEKSINNMHSDINATIDSLKNIKNKMQSASGGVGTLSGAVSSIQSRINSENQKLSSIDQLSQRVSTFVNNAITTDAQVATLVNANQEKFFDKYTWLRPSVEEEKSWWEKFVDGWNDFWGDIGEVLGKVLQGVVDFVKEHAVELIIGAVAIIVGAAIIALTGGAAAAFGAALLAGLKAATISALIGATISGLIAAFTGGDFLKAFGDGFASGFMWGGIFFAASSIFSAIRTAASANNSVSHAEQIKINQKNGAEFEKDCFKKFNKSVTNAEQQITIETPSGVRTRVDAIGIDKSTGDIVIQEYKSSLTAPKTANQTIAFPEIFEHGGIVKGAGKGIFSGGFEIPSGTNITIIRPEVVNPIKNIISNIPIIKIGFTGGFTSPIYKKFRYGI